MEVFDKTIKDLLNSSLLALENILGSDVIYYYGEIHPSYEKVFRDFVEQLKIDEVKRKRLSIILNTPGGSAETVEKMVSIIRYHYTEVYFIVPDYAMSAGTIFCMSGDKIFMDYSSSLGPIDPQVFNGSIYVPALGYLDKVEELINKSKKNELSDAEFLILQQLDLAMLRSFEQAKELTISLLKKWLVEYKFKNWTTHRTDLNKKGKQVSQMEKEERATQIANILGDNKIWHSHGRFIGINTLKNLLRLEIEDYSEDENLKKLIRTYNDMITGYILRNGFKMFLHSRNYF
jgi:membrane-bound ClpP family serine protease